MYLDILTTVNSVDMNGKRRFIDPKTVELLFLYEIIDNPSNTNTKCMSLDQLFITRNRVDPHHWVPIIEQLPGAFTSKGTVMNGTEVIDSLLMESSYQSESADFSLQTFPRGARDYIGSKLSDTIEYLLYANESVFVSFTDPLIRSVYRPNIFAGWLQSWCMRRSKLSKMHTSSVHCVEDCVRNVEETVSFLSHSVDVTDSMKLPLEVTSRLYAMMTVLLSIPLKDETLAPLASLLLESPQIAALEKWCVRQNEGCKLWPFSVIGWREAVRCAGGRANEQVAESSSKTAWWEWLGWSSAKHANTTGEGGPEAASDFEANKSHNIAFALVSVGALFVYVATNVSASS
jgi:hypothetical protein